MELKTTVKDLGRMPWFYRANSRTGKIFGKKSLHLDEETEMVIDYMHYPKGFTTVLHRHPASHGIYVLEGQLETDGELYGPGTFVWYPEGIAATHGATEYEDLKCLLISNKAFSIEYLEEEEQRQNSLEKKVMDVNRINHRHTAGHGFFVLEGQLQTGDELYGPGTFIWYPEGYVTAHGATEYEDLKCLQISNKTFNIEYV